MKSEIQLAYGRTHKSFACDAQQFQILQKTPTTESLLSDFEIGSLLDQPIDSPALDELVSAGDSVLLVVSDATRASGSAQIVNLVVRRLIEAGVAAADIAIIFATGIHRRVTEAERVELLTPFVTQRLRIFDHDPFQSLVQLDLKVGDIAVEVNRALKDFSHVIVLSAIGFHYFAGFTGGRKSICPGLASAKTIEATHMLALDFETGGRRRGVGTGKLAGNAVNEACEQIAATIAPTFTVNTVVDEKGRVVQVFAGHWREAHRTGCRSYMQTHSIKIDNTRALTIASCGGYPWDINLIQAHKSLDMAALATNEGGRIVLIAECADGLGRPDFMKWFEEKDSRALSGRLRENYEVNGQTAWSLLTKAERYEVYLISDLPDDQVRAMRMIPAKSLEEAVNNAEGFVMPRGAALLPVTAD